MANEKILVCDDEPAWLKVEKKILVHAGYKVSTADNGKQALEKIQILKPDLVILDIRMPGLDGYEVCSILKTDPDYEDIPIIMVTVMDMGEDFEKGERKGADWYITKPFSEKHLLKHIKALLEKKKSNEDIT